MRRGYTILIIGGILIAASVSIIVPSIYSIVELVQSTQTDFSAKDLISRALNINQTAIRESLRGITIDVGLAFFGIIVGIILVVNGIIAIIGGIVVLVLDKKRKST
jgi:hypothetical protein